MTEVHAALQERHSCLQQIIATAKEELENIGRHLSVALHGDSAQVAEIKEKFAHLTTPTDEQPAAKPELTDEDLSVAAARVFLQFITPEAAIADMVEKHGVTEAEAHDKLQARCADYHLGFEDAVNAEVAVHLQAQVDAKATPVLNIAVPTPEEVAAKAAAAEAAVSALSTAPVEGVATSGLAAPVGDTAAVTSTVG